MKWKEKLICDKVYLSSGVKISRQRSRHFLLVFGQASNEKTSVSQSRERKRKRKRTTEITIMDRPTGRRDVSFSIYGFDAHVLSPHMREPSLQDLNLRHWILCPERQQASKKTAYQDGERTGADHTVALLTLYTSHYFFSIWFIIYLWGLIAPQWLLCQAIEHQINKPITTTFELNDFCPIEIIDWNNRSIESQKSIRSRWSK